MSTEESEFEQLLDDSMRDAQRCATHVYTFQTFGHLTGSPPELVDVLDTHGAFWNGTLHAHLSAAFTSFGRLYETGDECNSLAGLLRYARTHMHLFSRESLAARKHANGLSLADAQEYASDSFEPFPAALAEANKAVAAARLLYEQKARPIRHKVFAHTEPLTDAVRNQLFRNFPAREFEKLAVVPLQASHALWGWYMNGVPPTLRDEPINIADVLAAKPASRVSTTHHLHVAADAAAFLESLWKAHA